MFGLLESRGRNSSVRGFRLNSDALTPNPGTGDRSGPTPKKWIQHPVTLFGRCQNTPLDQRDRLLGWMFAKELFCASWRGHSPNCLHLLSAYLPHLLVIKNVLTFLILGRP